MASLLKSIRKDGDHFSQKKVARALLWSGLLGSIVLGAVLLLLLLVDFGGVHLLTKGDESAAAAPQFMFNAGYIYVSSFLLIPLLSVAALWTKSRKLFVCHLIYVVIFILITISGGTLLLIMFNQLSESEDVLDARFELWIDQYMSFLVDLSQENPEGWKKIEDRFDCCGADAASIVSFDPNLSEEDLDLALQKLLSGDVCEDISNDALFLSLVSNFTGDDQSFGQILEENAIEVPFCEDRLRETLKDFNIALIAMMVVVLIGSIAGIVSSVFLLKGRFFPRSRDRLGDKLRNADSDGTEVKSAENEPTELLSTDVEEADAEKEMRIKSLSPELKEIYTASFRTSSRKTGSERNLEAMKEHFAKEEAAAARKSLDVVEEYAERNKPVTLRLKSPDLKAKSKQKSSIAPRKESVRDRVDGLLGRMEGDGEDSDSEPELDYDNLEDEL